MIYSEIIIKLETCCITVSILTILPLTLSQQHMRTLGTVHFLWSLSKVNLNKSLGCTIYTYIQFTKADNLICLSLDCKTKHLEEIHTGMRRTCIPAKKDPSHVTGSNSESSCCEAKWKPLNHCAASWDILNSNSRKVSFHNIGKCQPGKSSITLVSTKLCHLTWIL